MRAADGGGLFAHWDSLSASELLIDVFSDRFV
jgi:hypothetical protein